MKKPEVEMADLLASMIRLMTNYVQSPHESQLMTLLQIIKLIKEHPAYEKNPAVKVAIEQSKQFWLQKIGIDKQLSHKTIHNFYNKPLH